jgi:serine/threonine protein kinase
MSNVEYFSKVREGYEQLLKKAGVTQGVGFRDLKRYKATVNKVFEQFGKEVATCHDEEVAKSYFDKCKNFAGTSTILALVDDKELVIDGVLSNAFSNKAVLQRVVLKGHPYVFKYPLDRTDESQKSSILCDISFSELLTERAGGKPLVGIVPYTRFEIVANGSTVFGSLSPIYVMSLNELHAPLPKKFILNLCNRVLTALDFIHLQGWIVGDIKPSNLFLASNGDIDIGDFGGAVRFSSSLREYSYEYLPLDLHGLPATLKVDYACLVVTILEMMKARPSYLTLEGLRQKVNILADLDIKDLLVSLLEKC